MSTITVEAGTNVEPGHPNHSGETQSPEKVEASADVEIGDSIQEAIEMFGEDTVQELFERQVRRDAGNAIRSSLNNGSTVAATEEKMADWRPDVRRTGGGGQKSLKEQFEDLPEEKRREKLQELMEIAEG